MTNASEATPDTFILHGIELKQIRSRVSAGRLLRAAAELIAERGYERTTLAAVGQRAGYSHGLVTRRFGSKDGLLLALLHKMIAEWHEAEIAPYLREASGVDALRILIDGVRRSVRCDPGAMRALYTLMFEALKPEPALLGKRMREVHGRQGSELEDAIFRGIGLGNVRQDVDAGATARLVVSAMRGAAYQWLLEPDFDFDGTLAVLEEYLDHALTTHPVPAAR